MLNVSNMLHTASRELNEFWKTGSALVGKGYNRLLDTTAMKKVSKVVEPSFLYLKEKTPECIKRNKSFIYGAGTVVAIRYPLRRLSNTPNNHLEQAAKHFDCPGDPDKTEKARAIRALKDV